MAEIVGNWWFCIDCMTTHETGELPPDYPEDEELPLSNLTFSERRRIVVSAHEHAEHCTQEDRTEGCECGYSPFWTFYCDGCGRYTSGDCYDVVVFDR